MSGRVDPEQVIARLYTAVTDDRLSFLDELLIAAGYRYRCACGAMVPADGCCDQCGHTDDTCTCQAPHRPSQEGATPR